MEKIDRRKHYVLMVDTETANTLTDENGKTDMSNVLVYDCGWAVVDTHGGIYETASYVNSDIFDGEKDMMKSAYYSWKIPIYEADLDAGRRIKTSGYNIRKNMLDTIQKYNIKEVCAHNARFDYNALNMTERWTTCSKYRYWFPFDSVEIWDTMKMAQDVICTKPTYIQFCTENNYLVNNKPRKTAEILYRFISGKNDFQESHTGLEDVLIEAQIMFYCFRQHQSMRKKLFENSKEFPPKTEFQKAFDKSLREMPILKKYEKTY